MRRFNVRKETKLIRFKCFAHRTNDQGRSYCVALNELYCQRGPCNFYKTKEQNDKEAAEAYNTVMSKPQLIKNGLKYYEQGV